MDVLINLYEVGGVGRNFHSDCHNVVMTGAGKNQAAETQGIGRVLRVCSFIGKNQFLTAISLLTFL
jgi:hypothetical protein